MTPIDRARRSSYIFQIACLLAIIAGCASSQPTGDKESPAALTYDDWHRNAAWRFRLIDEMDQTVGDLILYLSNEPMANESCGESGWRKAVVLDEKFPYSFGTDLDPAYKIEGRWLTVDLTASDCALDYMLVGEFDEDGASGFFNYSYTLSGHNLGTFTATPVVREN